jgi:hypothetical protein
MKLDRRTLMVGAVAIAALAALSARESRRSTCTGRPCCLPFPGLAAFSTNVWAPAPPANEFQVLKPAPSLTNGTQ